MKALIYHGIGKMSLQEVPEPSGEVVLKVERVGICGTDLKAYLRGHHMFTPPAILGHECYGKVVSSSLETFQEGETVVLAPYAECGRCWRCQRGIGELCQEKTYLEGGCFAEYVSLSSQKAKRLLFKIKNDDEVFVLTEPLACVIEALKKLDKINNPLIVGGGPMGGLFALYLRIQGIESSIVEKEPWRVNYLKALGFDVRFPSEIERRNYDAIILCVDLSELIGKYLPLVEDGGNLLLFAGFSKGERIPLDPFHVHYREVGIKGSFGYKIGTFREALEELKSHPDEYRKLITHRFPLEKYEEAFKLLKQKESLKVIFEVG